MKSAWKLPSSSLGLGAAPLHCSPFRYRTAVVRGCRALGLPKLQSGKREASCEKLPALWALVVGCTPAQASTNWPHVLCSYLLQQVLKDNMQKLFVRLHGPGTEDSLSKQSNLQPCDPEVFH